jgi:DNA-binding transcriptional LysR family regulator
MRGPRVTLDQWRTLQAVIDCGGYAQAAEFLHKSQSSISYTVAKLQEQLGMELLIIEGRKAVLTPVGEALLRRARQLVDQAVDLEKLAASLEQGWEPELRVAIDGAFPTPIVIDACKSFAPQSQGCRLLLREEVLSGAEEALLEKKVDLAITGWVPPGFMGERLIDIHFIALAHPQHPLHQLGRKILQQDLAGNIQVVVKDSAQKRVRDSGWLGAEQRWTVSSVSSAINLLINGLGFAWMPTHVAQQYILDGSLKPLDLDIEYEKHFSLYLVFAQPDFAGPATRMMAQLIRDFSARYSAGQPSCADLRSQGCENQ